MAGKNPLVVVRPPDYRKPVAGKAVPAAVSQLGCKQPEVGRNLLVVMRLRDCRKPVAGRSLPVVEKQLGCRRLPVGRTVPAAGIPPG